MYEILDKLNIKKDYITNIIKQSIDQLDKNYCVKVEDKYYVFVINNNEIIKLLKIYKDKLILIRGNCDYFIDYEKIGLYANDIITIKANNYDITFTHGNRYYRGFMPDFYGDIFVSGHTHIPMILKEKHTIYANPGSIGLPRGGSQKSYMVFNDNYIELKTIDGVLEKKMNL